MSSVERSSVGVPAACGALGGIARAWYLSTGAIPSPLAELRPVVDPRVPLVVPERELVQRRPLPSDSPGPAAALIGPNRDRFDEDGAVPSFEGRLSGPGRRIGARPFTFAEMASVWDSPFPGTLFVPVVPRHPRLQGHARPARTRRDESTADLRRPDPIRISRFPRGRLDRNPGVSPRTLSRVEKDGGISPTRAPRPRPAPGDGEDLASKRLADHRAHLRRGRRPATRPCGIARGCPPPGIGVGSRPSLLILLLVPGAGRR